MGRKETYNSPARPAQGAALADLNTGRRAQLAPPVVNLYLRGSCNNLNFGGLQYLGQNTGALADTIKAQAATIAAQQRTIDHLLAIIEGMTARDR